MPLNDSQIESKKASPKPYFRPRRTLLNQKGGEKPEMENAKQTDEGVSVEPKVLAEG